ncbi:MAG: flagellar export protein FliJ [Acidimicrobiales bacterium]|jgi:flagellar export protein FliJ|nr:hypothetical protein [Actinomycetota bacterium]
MKAYHFRLDALLRLRRAEEQGARYALAAANRRLREAHAQMSTRQLAYEQLPRSRAVLPASLFRSEAAAGALSARALRHAQLVFAHAEADSNAQLGRWQLSRTRVAVLERLDDRRRAEHAVEELKQEIRELDDIVGTRWGAASTVNGHGNVNANANGNGGADSAAGRGSVRR